MFARPRRSALRSTDMLVGADKGDKVPRTVAATQRVTYRTLSEHLSDTNTSTHYTETLLALLCVHKSSLSSYPGDIQLQAELHNSSCHISLTDI